MEELNSEDIQLIKSCINNEQLACSKLYKKYSAWLYSICLRYTNNEDEAQDALQESFISIFKNLNQYSMELNFRAWMKKIAVNMALGSHRKKNAMLYNRMHNEVGEDAIVDNQIINTLGMQELKFYISKLSPGRKQVFNAYCVEGYTHPEIAKMLQISVGTSKSQLFHAKKELKYAIEKELSILKTKDNE